MGGVNREPEIRLFYQMRTIMLYIPARKESRFGSELSDNQQREMEPIA